MVKRRLRGAARLGRGDHRRLAAASTASPELAEEVLDLPVRRGVPRGVGGLVDVVRSPTYATGVGLVLYGRGASAATAVTTGDGSAYSAPDERCCLRRDLLSTAILAQREDEP